jgi:hypothetical protein
MRQKEELTVRKGSWLGFFTGLCRARAQEKHRRMENGTDKLTQCPTIAFSGSDNCLKPILFLTWSSPGFSEDYSIAGEPSACSLTSQKHLYDEWSVILSSHNPR